MHDSNYYIGKESLFPFNRFSGYHSAADYEIFPGEEHQPVPVFAVNDGEIIYASNVNGYGGLIIQTLSDSEHLALYGHVVLDGIKVGDNVRAGQILTFLGDQFSSETGRERKHLHFGIHKGTNVEFQGYESVQSALIQKWEDPMEFLKNRSATVPVMSQAAQSSATTQSSVTVATPATIGEDSQKPGILDGLIKYFRTIFQFLSSRS